MSYKLIWFEYGQAGCSLDTFPGSLDLCITLSVELRGRKAVQLCFVAHRSKFL
jgi:hypothetical protein